MNQISLHRAFASFGAQTGHTRLLSAMASDGSLVLVCNSSGFTRPDVGVMRYTAQLSTCATPQSRLAALRGHIGDAHAAGTIVRLIIETFATGQSVRTHVRPDLVGKVIHFDGDEYQVDFSRPPPPPVLPKARRRG